MCGIAGFLIDAAERPDIGRLTRMCDSLAHRGPDDAGYFVRDGVALGHRRLSIIDVAGGAQPLGNEDGAIQVVFNGEIYNYRELRRELVERDHRFATNSDTEVLVHLYEECGERLPERLNGMFAFAIWDGRRRELFAARDRIGKKPFYYSVSVPPARFCFASELKALAALPGFKPAISAPALADYLAFGYIPDPATIWRDVFKLAPGCSLTVTGRGLRVRRYWTPTASPDGSADFETSVEEIRSIAEDAVERRMISDVPLGGFLSGGVDSSYAVACMARTSRERVKTFSIGFTTRQFDERTYAQEVAAHCDTEHRDEVVTPSILSALSTLTEHFDEPFADSSAIPTLYLARMARKYVTVAIAGDGADEIFAGYRRYYFGALEQRLRAVFPEAVHTSFRTAGRLCPKLDYLPRPFRAKALLTNLSCAIGDAYYNSMTGFRDGALTAALAPEVNRALGGYDPRETYRARFETVRDLSPLEQMQVVDLQTYLPGDILVKADRASMAHSLEVRSPWLDSRLVELALRLPSRFKLRGKVGKHIFKEAARPFVPPAVVSRTKMGFSVPLAEWLRGSLKPAFEAVVLRGQIDDLISTAEARRLWEEHQSGFHNHERKLWSLLVLGCWAARHRDGTRVCAQSLAEMGAKAGSGD